MDIYYTGVESCLQTENHKVDSSTLPTRAYDMRKIMLRDPIINYWISEIEETMDVIIFGEET